jgi:hypothetical protein
MRARSIAGVVAFGALSAACGSVQSDPPGDAAAGDAPDTAARTYRGMVAETAPPVMFGGPPPNCVYTQVLRQVMIELAILPSGRVVSGQVQNINVEGLAMPCMFLPADPTITNFTFVSAMASEDSQTLAFQQRAGDKPGATLEIALTVAGAGYSAQLTFHRTDLRPPLDWTVVTSAMLQPLP